MPAASSIPELFDFEGQFESAAQAILVAAGIVAYISQQKDQAPLISTGISFDVNPALDQLTQIPKPPGWPVGMEPPMEYFRYTGTIEFRVNVARDKNTATDAQVATMLAQIRGMIRGAFMLSVFPFDATNLPFYRVSDIKPNGTSTGFDQVENKDFTSLRFVITWAINGDSWPW